MYADPSRGRVNSSALRWPQRTVLGNADVSRRCGDSPTSYSVPINAASELIEELVYSVVCMRRDSSRIRLQIGKRRESQMSLIGAETCRMNAACALGLFVAGLRGRLRKLPFGVSACYAGLAPPVVHLGWVACSGDVFPNLSSEFEDSLYGVVNGRVCKRRGEHLAACRGYLARRRGDYRRLARAGRTLNCKEAVRR